MDTEDVSASDVIGHRVNQLRRKQGLSGVQLARRCAEVGAPALARQVIFNIENGRRDESGRRRRFVNVEELLALARALRVSPLHLLVPPNQGPHRYPVTTTEHYSPKAVREWIRGEMPLSGEDSGTYYTEVPAEELRIVTWRGEEITPTAPDAYQDEFPNQADTSTKDS